MIVHMKNIFLIVCIFLLSAFDFQDKKKDKDLPCRGFYDQYQGSQSLS